MAEPAALPVTTADNGDVTSDMKVAVKQIDLTLINQIHTEQKHRTAWSIPGNLLGKPSAYKLGPGDVLQITVWDHPEFAAAVGQPTQNTKPSDAARVSSSIATATCSFPDATDPCGRKDRGASPAGTRCRPGRCSSNHK